MNAPEHDDPFGRDLARMAGDLTPVVDGAAMAGQAIRREKRRHMAVTVAACVAGMVAISAAIGAGGIVYADRQEPLPASTVTATPSPDGAERHDEPVRHELTYTHPEIGEIRHGVPAGWTEATTEGFRYAYPPRWTERPNDQRTFGEMVEIRSDEVVVRVPGYEDPEVRWNGYVESGDPGPNFWPGWVNTGLDGTHEIEVPGADYAVAQVTEGPFYADGRRRSLSVNVHVHQEGEGNHAKVVLNWPGGEDGKRLLREFLGTLSYEAGPRR
ncbi:hypothetical protein [Myceligenerans crystallogenes]|uniref:Uncharacterized protein n=1 Tax=Myceligenerans crystallogenes TaxID=316335 RepID=A0ABN2N3P2_9MICO